MKLTLATLQKNFVEQLVQHPSSLISPDLLILHQPPLSNQKRFAVYQEAFQLRMQEALSEDFILTLQQIGKKTFNNLVNQYCQQYPSNSWTLAERGNFFASFIQQQLNFNNSSLTQWPYLADLAQLDWLQVLVDLVATSAPLNLTKLNSNFKIKLADTVQLLESEWNLLNNFELNKTYLLITKNTSPKILTNSDWQILKQIADGCTLETLADSLTNLTNCAVADWFKHYAELGLFQESTE